MIALVLLSIGFVILNILDSYTTYLNLFRLPASLMGKEGEMNPIFRGSVNKHFGRTVLIKTIGVILIIVYVFIFSKNQSDLVFALKAINIMIAFVVINNAYIYLAKRITNRKVMSPGKFLTKVCHLPNTVAFVLLMVIIALASYGIAIVL